MKVTIQEAMPPDRGHGGCDLDHNKARASFFFSKLAH